MIAQSEITLLKVLALGLVIGWVCRRLTEKPKPRCFEVKNLKYYKVKEMFTHVE
jgi:flagellar biogenesis protein FliO